MSKNVRVSKAVPRNGTADEIEVSRD
jgi:hypothetical protein